MCNDVILDGPVVLMDDLDRAKHFFVYFTLKNYVCQNLLTQILYSRTLVFLFVILKKLKRAKTLKVL